MRTFFKVALALTEEIEGEVRGNGGYSLEELGMMKKSFKRYDLDDSGTIQNQELVALVKCVFPDMANDPKLRPQLMEIIREADEDGNDALDFEDFLRLMRTVCDLRSRNQLEKEKTAVSDTGFEAHEIYEFRLLFQAQVNRHMLLPFEEFEAMIHGICPLGDRNLAILEGMFSEALVIYDNTDELRELSNASELDPKGGRDCIDFPEFLWIMKQILDTNFGGVLQRTQQRRLSQTTSDAVQSVPTDRT